jgi:GT2 family glycosyltransferase
MRSTFGAGGPTITVVVAAYNQPRELALALSALAAQTDLRFDVVVADDGSDPPARCAVSELAEKLPFAVDWLWQRDAGFRKMRAQNRAVLRRPAELLLFLDGDCLPHRDWVEVYRRSAQPGEFLVGGYIFLSDEQTRSLSPESVCEGAHERALGPRAWWRLHHRHWRNQLYSGRHRNRPRIRGGNFAVARDLFERVDGFDEALCGYSKEDSDLRNRMRNAGARGISLWTRARVSHVSRRVFPGMPRPPTPPRLYEESFQRIEARIGLSSHASRP